MDIYIKKYLFKGYKMNDLEVVSLLTKLVYRFPSMEWVTEEIDWTEVEDSEDIYTYIWITETQRICILVGHFRKFTLRVVFEYEDYTYTLKSWWPENVEELLNNLEVWLQEIRSINERYTHLRVEQLLEQLQEKFPKLNFVKDSKARYDLVSLSFGKAPITVYGSLRIGEKDAISMTIYEDLLIRVEHKNKNRNTEVEKQSLHTEEEILLSLEEWLISMYLALNYTF